MKKKAIIISSISAIMLCIALTVGLTVALFTSSTPINISVHSGKVELFAEIVNAKVYSLKADPSGDISEGGITYRYEECANGKFANGGTASVKEDGSVVLNNVSAGDKVVFDIKVRNDSTIPVMFSTNVALVNQEKNALFDALNPVVKAAFVNGDANMSLMKDNDGKEIVHTGWTALCTAEQAKADGIEDENTATVTVSLGLPAGAANHVQGMAVSLKCIMSAVQFTGDVSSTSIATITEGDVKKMYMSMEGALNDAIDGDTVEVYNSDPKFSGKYEIGKSVTIMSADGVLKEMKDVQLSVADGHSVELNGLRFTGSSLLDVSGASEFTMKNCYINAAPEKLFDEGTQGFLPRAAFLVSSSVRQMGMRLTLTDNTFVPAEDTAAVYLAGAVADGSLFSGNAFGGTGTTQKAYDGYTVELCSLVNGATVTVEDNIFVGNSGVRFTSAAVFKAVLRDNEMTAGEGTAVLASSEGGVAELYDNGSTVNGEAITLAHLQVESFVKGIGVTFDEVGRINSGSLVVYGSADDFRTNIAPDANVTVSEN